MGSPVAVALIRIVEVLFFLGLAGSAITILASWISVLKGCFRDESDPRPTHHAHHAHH